MKRTIFSLLLMMAVLVLALPVMAGGPWGVDGKGSGKPNIWKGGSIPWIVEDNGVLKDKSREESLQLINDAFKVWEKVLLDQQNSSYPTAVVKFVQKGVYKGDKKSDPNDPIKSYADLEAASDYAYSNSVALVVFDEKGQIFDEKGIADNVIAMTLTPSLHSDGIYIKSGIILIDGSKLGSDNAFAAVVHEVGHLLNLDHTDLNDELAGKAADADAVPTMYPVADFAEQASLHRDDLIAVSSLYPSTYFSDNSSTNKFCTIDGVIKGNNDKPFQGADVIAFAVNDVYFDARSMVSGVYYPPGTLNGAYYLRGIIPNRKYLVKYGPVNPGFTGNSGLEPFPDNPKKGFEVGSISFNNGSTFEVSCIKGGQHITMDTVVLPIPATGGSLPPDPGGSGNPPDEEAAKGNGCQLTQAPLSSYPFLTFALILCSLPLIWRGWYLCVFHSR